VIWLHPIAWWGLLAVLVPIAIHLIARPRSRRVLFPSLRFLRANNTVTLSSLRLSDWPLLVVRTLILAMATAAVAGPLLVTDARRTLWERRTARAFVVHGDQTGTAARVVEEESQRSFTHAQFTAPSVADAIRGAVAWLDRQPPSLREMVLVGDFRDGDIAGRDLAPVPAATGVRFLPVDAPPGAEVAEASVVADGPRGPERFSVRVTASAEETRAEYAEAGDASMPALQIIAPPASQRRADAMLRAILRDGVVLDPRGDRRVAIVFDSAAQLASTSPSSAQWMRRVLEAHPDIQGAEADGALVVHMQMPITDPRAVGTAAAVIRSAFGAVIDAREPRRIPAATLSAWARPPAGLPEDAPFTDEGDRRWLWVVVVLLLAIETVLRRVRAEEESPVATSGHEGESRVA
jgi:hypothetical protein